MKVFDKDTYLTPDEVGKLMEAAGRLGRPGHRDRAQGACNYGFPVHPHMLRHACGYKLANEGHDTWAIQHYMGHRNIQQTVRYTDLAAARFNGFWKD